MAKRLEMDPEAAREAAFAYTWYSQRSIQVAERFADALDDAIAKVCEEPGRFPLHYFGTRRCLLDHFPYLVVFREKGDVIEVLAVAHTRRRPGYWSRRS